MSNTHHPRISVLVAALGGEGGGVLTDWIVAAARKEGLRVQSTSIPGVAQRTGATTYYLEMVAEAAGPVPLGLTPMASRVDLVVASELIEATRAAQHGYLSPDTTTLIASTHRVFATSEKSHGGDGRFNTEGALKAIRELSRRCVLFDFDLATQQSRSAISVIMFGAIAGSGALPIRKETFIEVIKESKIAVESNLRGFEMAHAIASGTAADPAQKKSRPRPLRNKERAQEYFASVQAAFPVEAHAFIQAGIERLIDYQGERYARLFVERLRPIVSLENGSAAQEHELTREVARNLALRMSFEDIARVADLKTRRSRFERVRQEAGARPGQPVEIVEYLKPGVEEIFGFAPAWLGRRVIGWAVRTGRLHSFSVGIHLKTSSVSGFFLMWLMAKLRALRPFGYRYREEQANIETWLRDIKAGAAVSYPLALEIVECARLIKGYGDTYRRGLDNFHFIFEQLVYPAIKAGADVTAQVRAARETALATAESGPALKSAKPDSSAATTSRIMWLEQKS